MAYSIEDKEIYEDIYSLYGGEQEEVKEDKNTEDKLKENIQTINDITEKKLGSKIKKRMEGNIKGALLGGAFGVVIGIANRQSPLIYGIIGLLIGKLVFNNKLSDE
jgi:hypothetical protein|tara:strand:- start:30936 stop:31253 length:318 start_codon:yes stop_codon:yes gene_type:complete